VEVIDAPRALRKVNINQLNLAPADVNSGNVLVCIEAFLGALFGTTLARKIHLTFNR